MERVAFTEEMLQKDSTVVGWSSGKLLCTIASRIRSSILSTKQAAMWHTSCSYWFIIPPKGFIVVFRFSFSMSSLETSIGIGCLKVQCAFGRWTGANVRNNGSQTNMVWSLNCLLRELCDMRPLSLSHTHAQAQPFTEKSTCGFIHKWQWSTCLQMGDFPMKHSDFGMV